MLINAFYVLVKEDGDESELNSSRIGVDSDIKMTGLSEFIFIIIIMFLF